METSIFKVAGMTCQACVKKVTEKISTISGVRSVDVSLSSLSAKISADRKINLAEVILSLATEPKYKVSDRAEAVVGPAPSEIKESFIKTYKPLLTIFAFILLVSTAYQINLGNFDSKLFMNHLMAGFFIGLSFFKFLDLNAFAESFAGYDPIAKKWAGYGKVYPFIELILGLLFVSGLWLKAANILTLIVLSLTTYGVFLKLQTKSKFQCACLGTTFNLPLSNVTIAENLLMIAMALYNLAAM